MKKTQPRASQRKGKADITEGVVTALAKPPSQEYLPINNEEKIQNITMKSSLSSKTDYSEYSRNQRLQILRPCSRDIQARQVYSLADARNSTARPDKTLSH